MAGIDPITYQTLLSSITAIVDEMQYQMYRSAYSTIIRESLDASCALLTKEGQVIVQHAFLPLHLGVFPRVIESIRDNYEIEEMREGDAFITNHPYHGAPHSPDLATARPIFYKGELVAFSCNMAHKSDMGGMVPGSGSSKATELFQEGLILPPIKYCRQGEVVRELERIIATASRTPHLVIGDIRTQIGANKIGSERLRALLDRHGVEIINAFLERLFDSTEKQLRLHLAGWEDKTVEAEGFIDGNGIDNDTRVRLHARVTVKGDRIYFDLSDCDAQQRGPVNIRPFLIRSAAHYALLCMTEGSIPNNHALNRVVEIKVREGTVVHPVQPASTNCYIITVQKLTEVLLRALGCFNPERAIADTGGDGAFVIGSRGARTGRPSIQYEILGSAYGGGHGQDGTSGVGVHLANCRAASIEVIEAEFPARLLRFDLIQDSGGPGKYRGGLGFRREYQVLEDGSRFTMRCDRHAVAPEGIRGGKQGKLGSCTINPGTEREKRLPALFADIILKEGDIVRVERPGGGGFGDPLDRTSDDVLRDVLERYVSVEGAREMYGVGIDERTMKIDEQETASLRSRLRNVSS